jgi:hypothetical protein
MLEVIKYSPDLLHRNWIRGLTKDDHLWFQLVVTARSQGLHLQGGLPHVDWFLWKMIQMGYTNGKPEDHPWDGSTRAMRYGAVFGDRIQANIEIEKMRVSIDSLMTSTNDLALTSPKAIVWRLRLQP